MKGLLLLLALSVHASSAHAEVYLSGDGNSKTSAAAHTSKQDQRIIGGYGDYRYQYMPHLLELPAGTKMVNAHGLVVDADHNIYLTYVNDHKVDPDRCLIRWRPDGTGGEDMLGGGSALCRGTPHGLKIAKEWNATSGGSEQFLYHTNNDKMLTKTTLDGTIVWQRRGHFGQDPKSPYRPTNFAIPPDSRFIYLCDGYASNNVYVFDRYTGTFMNRTFGGRGGRDQHGKFSTNHGCTYDPRVGKIAVSDRVNSRIEYFDYDPLTPDRFEYSHTVDMRPSMGEKTLPCNLRVYPEQQAISIMPDLNGPTSILDSGNRVVSVVNVSVLLAAEKHLHPHDAVLLPNGDLVVATWNPGRIGYWKRLPPGDSLDSDSALIGESVILL